MAINSMRDWINTIEQIGQLKRITAEVDWDLELGAIARRVVNQQGPALLFENIKDYKNTPCRKVFINGLGSLERVSLALDLPKGSRNRDIVKFFKGQLSKRAAPVIVGSGPVKQNIISGDHVDLFKLPVPHYNYMDGGRYINSHACTVTMDPDTQVMNVGVYRGMICGDGKSISVLLIRSQHWGNHFSKYERKGEHMPVAVAYGCDPLLLMCAGSNIDHPGCSEYEVAGGVRNEPLELVKCETSDLYVPASAEIVVEGFISPDSKTFQQEGPFGEYCGFYGGHRELRPVIKVELITHRDNPIFSAHLAGHSPGRLGEDAYWEAATNSACIWNYLDTIGIPGVTGVWGPPVTCLTNLRISIDKQYRGHAKQVAAALWGSKLSAYYGKNLIVVDNDIDVFDDQAIEWALAYRTNADMGDVQFFSGTMGSPLDPSTPLPQRDTAKFKSGKWARLFIDATVNWELEKEEQYGGRREPPLCTVVKPEVDHLVNQRWHEYGF